MTWFILSLIAILFWSGSDLFSKLGSRPDDKYSHWKMVMAVGVVMGAHAFFLIATGTPFSISDKVKGILLPSSDIEPQLSVLEVDEIKRKINETIKTESNT